MVRHRSADHPLVSLTSWEPDWPAEQIAEQILMSRGTSNSYLVTTSDGDVVINAGMPYQGPRHRERYEEALGRPLRVRKIIFTQSHPDHMGGWSAFHDPGVETIAQAGFPAGRLDRTLLAEFFQPRSRRIVGGLNPAPRHLSTWFQGTAEPEVDTFFLDSHSFELGGRRFELYATPGGETLDSLIVWLPADRAVFTGNLMGALHGALPALYTPRGDRIRSARQFIVSVDRVLALEPELLITGHGAPITGSARIRADVVKVLEAVRYIHDQTVAGMNAGLDPFTLMASVELPAELALAPGRGPVAWYVRAVWEEYVGWFRMESTTELYEVPPRAVWTELAELSGGVAVLAERAARHAAAGRPLEALHLVDIALHVDPHHHPSRQAQTSALEQLVDRTRGQTYDELAWLETELTLARAALSEPEPTER